jgi:CBS domain-containing protein
MRRGGKRIGRVSDWRVGPAAAKEGEMKAADIMARPVVSVTPETGVAEAARLMLNHRISGLPAKGDRRLRQPRRIAPRRLRAIASLPDSEGPWRGWGV